MADLDNQTLEHYTKNAAAGKAPVIDAVRAVCSHVIRNMLLTD